MSLLSFSIRVGIRIRFCIAVIALTSRPARADEPPIPPVPVRILVTEGEGGEPAQTDAWIDEQLASAMRLYAPIGVTFRVAERRRLPLPRNAVETRADRDALVSHVRPGALDVIVVRSLRDVDDPSQMRKGVCWRVGETRFVVLSAIAPPTVLAHEIGHYLGLPHSKVRDNLMSYERSGAEVFLDAAQVRTVRARARMLTSATR